MQQRNGGNYGPKKKNGLAYVDAIVWQRKWQVGFNSLPMLGEYQLGSHWTLFKALSLNLHANS